MFASGSLASYRALGIVKCRLQRFAEKVSVCWYPLRLARLVVLKTMPVLTISLWIATGEKFYPWKIIPVSFILDHLDNIKRLLVY
jgi:hypothetical protein